MIWQPASWVVADMFHDLIRKFGIQEAYLKCVDMDCTEVAKVALKKLNELRLLADYYSIDVPSDLVAALVAQPVEEPEFRRTSLDNMMRVKSMGDFLESLRRAEKI